MKKFYPFAARRIGSAGTSAYHVGEGADGRMLQAARAKGYDLSRHRARQVKEADFAKYDLLLAMDYDNFLELKTLARDSRLDVTAEIETFLENGNVPDPYYGGPSGFVRVIEIIERGCRRWGRRLGWDDEERRMRKD